MFGLMPKLASLNFGYFDQFWPPFNLMVNFDSVTSSFGAAHLSFKSMAANLVAKIYLG
jgi:hypothetical protein